MAAVIDINSSVVRMNIAQWDTEKIVVLDRLEKPVQLGKEVFSTGYVSFDTLGSLLNILNGFREKAFEYGISSLPVIASTAFREASNQAYILDHILRRTKLDVEVLDDTEVSAILFDAMKNHASTPERDVLFVYGGTGTTDFHLIKNEKSALAHSIQTGLLKIAEMLREASDFSSHTESMAEEYIYSFLNRENRIKDMFHASKVFFSAANLQPLYKLLGVSAQDGVVSVKSAALLQVYDDCRSYSNEQLCNLYQMPAHQSEMLYSTIALLAAILRRTKAKRLYCAQLSLADALLDILLRPGARRSHNSGLRSGALSSAVDLAKRYRCDIAHCLMVTETAERVLSKLKGPFGFSKRHETLLQIACILHECGYFINSENTQQATFDLVKNAHIYGLRRQDALLAANIIVPNSFADTRNTGQLDEDILLASKMNAILQLADSLDASRKQKATLREVSLSDDSLVISVRTDEDITLETWMFRQSALLLRESFGISPELKVRSRYGLEESEQ